jgi:hypothetical protein
MSAPRTVVTALLGNEECVTVATLQEQARLLPGEENLLAMYITSAREMVEQYTGRAIRQKRYTASFDCQGADLPWWDGVVEAARGALTFPEIELPWIPLVSVQEVRTYDLVDTEQVADVASYRVDTSSDAMVGRVILRAGYTWPPVGRSRNVSRWTTPQGTTEQSSPSRSLWSLRSQCSRPTSIPTVATVLRLTSAWRSAERCPLLRPTPGRV